MTFTSEITDEEPQEFAADSPVLHLVVGIDYIFTKLGVTESCFRNPSNLSEENAKVAGMTNSFLQPTRIGRKAVLGKADFYYGRKFNLTPDVYELVSFDAPKDIFAFVENRVRETLTDYMSIHRENFRLSLDIQNGVITSLSKIGFDEEFTYLLKNTVLTIGDLEKIIQGVLAIA
ncbi:MAG: hypothetical protein KKG47_04390 [Proteobacteria bacterium]|nr:hypothetical protein [Pseudomonadota bacterium]MBU1738181.1 hypothetical protein [Pseudomonadota bacterium]